MGQKSCVICGGRGGWRNSYPRPNSFEYDHVWQTCGACGGTGTIYEPDPKPLPSRRKRGNKHKKSSPQSVPLTPSEPNQPVERSKSRERKVFFPEVDAWLKRTLPPRKVRRISMLLTIVGALIGYAYAAAAGLPVVGWTILGAMVGFGSLMLLLWAIKAVLAVLIVVLVVAIFYLFASMLGGS